MLHSIQLSTTKDTETEIAIVARETRQIGEITLPVRFVAVVGTSEITLTREVDKAQSFVHDKTRSPWNRRDRWWFLNVAPTVTYTGRQECMHGAAMIYPQTWLNTGVEGGGGGRVGASVEKIYATCSRAENDERAGVHVHRNVCSSNYLYEVPASTVFFVGIHAGVNRIRTLRLLGNDIMLH